MNVNKIHYQNSIIETSFEHSGDTDSSNDGNSSVTSVSCKDILESGNSTGDGVYTINNGSKDYEVYCDMTNNGGGWTLVYAQFENNPVDWNEGIQSDYDPTLSTFQSFALNSSELPEHQHSMMNKALFNELPKANNFYFDFVYSTGDIPVTLINVNGSTTQYQISRSKNSFFSYCDPEAVYRTDYSQWFNSLTIDLYGNINPRTYCFAPNNPNAYERGFSYEGDLQFVEDNFSWVMWVK
jgi:hypothetical protein